MFGQQLAMLMKSENRYKISAENPKRLVQLKDSGAVS